MSAEFVVYVVAHVYKLGPSRVHSNVFNLPFGCSHLCGPLMLETLSKKQCLALGPAQPCGQVVL